MPGHKALWLLWMFALLKCVDLESNNLDWAKGILKTSRVYPGISLEQSQTLPFRFCLFVFNFGWGGLPAHKGVGSKFPESSRKQAYLLLTSSFQISMKWSTVGKLQPIKVHLRSFWYHKHFRLSLIIQSSDIWSWKDMAKCIEKNSLLLRAQAVTFE